MLENMKKLARRDMLKISGTIAAGAVLAGCSSPIPEPTEEAMPEDNTEEEIVAEEPETLPTSGHVVCMHILAEFNEDHVNAFMELNPGITLEVVDGEDPTRFFAIYAAGTPPDISNFLSYEVQRISFEATHPDLHLTKTRPNLTVPVGVPTGEYLIFEL